MAYRAICKNRVLSLVISANKSEAYQEKADRASLTRHQNQLEQMTASAMYQTFAMLDDSLRAYPSFAKAILHRVP